jgi:hypothetical protein
MRRPVALWFGLALAALASGCRHCDCDRVESELRAREMDVHHLRAELDRCSIYNQALQQELSALRGDGLPPGGPGPTPISSLVLGRQTGGRSNDSCDGDDALQVQVEPRDADNQAVKVAGALVVGVQEVTKEGTKRPLSVWEIPPEQLRRYWRSGLLTSGYVLNLPWKVWPSTEKLRVTAQFQLPDGRVLEADKDVTVRLVPANRRPTVVVPGDKAAPAPPPSPSDGPSLQPVPAPADPGKGGAPWVPPAATPLPAPQTTSAPTSLWRSVEPLPPPPAAEILRPEAIRSR